MKNIFTLTILKRILLMAIVFHMKLNAQTLSFTINPNLQCFGQPTVFVYGGVTSTVAGATSYSWSILSSSGQAFISWTGIGLDAQAWGMTLGSSGTITCYAYNVNTNAIITSLSQNYVVGPMQNPVNFNVSASSNSFCAGSSVTLSASGSIGYYWPSLNISSHSVVVTPTTSTCYVVYSNAACTNASTVCLTMLPLPFINIIGNNTVCLGSSLQFTATGGQNYAWSNGISTSTNSFIPLNSSTLAVVGTNAATGCSNTTSISYSVNNNCAIVWPGDANRDSQVNNLDVFELGLHNASTGPLRPSGNVTWTGQFANAWTGNGSTGWNKCHADCNGDGIINNADLGAISSNFGLNHAFKTNQTGSNIDLNLSPQQSELYSGLWNKIDVLIGDTLVNQTQLYGTAFTLLFDNSLIETDSVFLSYNNSFLNAGQQNIEFSKLQFTNGKLYAASVRSDHNQVNGFGKIAELRFKLKANIANNTSFVFGIANGKRTNASGTMSDLGTIGQLNININTNATGLNQASIEQAIQLYPHPAQSYVIVNNRSNTLLVYRIFDLSGRELMTGQVGQTQRIDISSLSKGLYSIEFNSTMHKSRKKLMID